MNFNDVLTLAVLIAGLLSKSELLTSNFLLSSILILDLEFSLLDS